MVGEAVDVTNIMALEIRIGIRTKIHELERQGAPALFSQAENPGFNEELEMSKKGFIEHEVLSSNLLNFAQANSKCQET